MHCAEHLDGNITSVNDFPVSLQNGKTEVREALDTGGSERKARSNRECEKQEKTRKRKEEIC